MYTNKIKKVKYIDMKTEDKYDYNVLLWKKAMSEDYWVNDNFSGFIRYYANNTLLGVGRTQLVEELADLIEKPYKDHYRREYYRFLIKTYGDENDE